MRCFRYSLWAGCALWLAAGLLHAQESSSAESSTGSSTGASGGSVHSDAGGGPGPSSSGSGPSGVPAASSFGAGTPETSNAAPDTAPAGHEPSSTDSPSLPYAPPASSFASPSSSAEGATQQPAQAPTTFTVPAPYGSIPQTYTMGQGRFARPRFRYTGSILFGLDDNVLSAAINGRDIPAVRAEVLVKEAVPEQRFLVLVPPTGRVGFFGARPQFREVVIPAQKAKFKTVEVFPGQPKAKQIASFVARANAGAEVQFATKRTVFTLDANLNASYYPSRPGDPEDINGSLNLGYLYKISPRMQFGASVNLAYLSQPDVSRISSPVNNVGDYFTGSVRMQLAYAITKRFSTALSLSVNSIVYNQLENSSFYETLVGLEGRYLLTPRLTLIGETRASKTFYLESDDRNSHSLILLGGAEMALSRKITASARVGVQLRTFELNSETTLGPFLETGLGWRYHPAGSLVWTTRFGYEEPPDAFTTVQVLRTTLSLSQAFSARLKATAGIAVAHRISEPELSGSGGTTISDNSLSIDAGMQYSLSKHMTLLGTYSFIGNLTTIDNSNYLRNQIFFGIQYTY